MINKAGAGLGLTIIKSLVENQDGRIYVTSRPGTGSVFTVYLTMKVAGKQEIRESLPEIDHQINAEDVVWIVDDDKLILDLCDIIFRKNNIPHQAFNTPAAMLAAPWDPAVKSILMDMRMPEISGVELCSRMRKQVPADVRIFAMTAQVLPEELNAVLAYGFDGLIMKPFRENDLLAVLARKEESTAGMEVRPADVLTPLAQSKPVAMDISTIERMTFGDADLLDKILRRYREDCSNDAAELTGYLEAPDLAQARLIVHRIAGRTAQMGSGELAAEFRDVELQLAAAAELTEELRSGITALLEKLGSLMLLVDAKLS